MSISSTTNFTKALGNGSDTVFTFSFVADSADDISVAYAVGSASGTVLSQSVYTLFINPPATGQIWGVGGTVVYPLTGSPIANGTSLTVARTLPLTQTISISNQGDFAPKAIEAALDTLCMQIQQVASAASQNIITNLGYTPMNGANNLSEITSASSSRTNLGLGTIATQNANAIAVTGGTLSGVAVTGSSYVGTVSATGGLIASGGETLTGSFTQTDTTGSGFTSTITNGGAFNVTLTGGGDFNLSGDNLSFDGAGLSLTGSGSATITSGDAEIFLFGNNASISGDSTTISATTGALGLSSFSGVTNDNNFTFTSASKGVILKRGANGRVGTVTLTGTTAVTVSNTNIATSDLIAFSIATVGGTVGAVPVIKTITSATGFTVAGTVGDTSTYNYQVTKSAL